MPTLVRDLMTTGPVDDNAVREAGAAVSHDLVIRPSGGWRSLDLRELWRYRELLYFLVWRDVKVRYKQTALGVIWAVLQPVLAMVIFTIFFGRLARLPSDGLPYELFAFAALVPWMFFANGLTQSSNSLVASQNLLKKVYFPRIALPIASVLASAVDFGLAFSVLVITMLFYGVIPTANAMWLPLFFLLALTTALGVGLWFSAWNVRYRDVQHIVPFLIQIWLFATPIVYPSSLLDEPWRTVYALNPMVGVVEGFRWALLGGAPGAQVVPPSAILIASSATAVAILLGGAFYFRRVERTLADVV
jgi:lipopolysaccharide transport system permease protein